MTVTLNYDQLIRSATAAEELAQAIRTNVTSAQAATPIDLPSLQPLEAKARWLDEQVPMLQGLADLAMLLDENGNGQVSMSMSDITDTLKDLLGAAVGTEFGNLFATGDFSLAKAALAIGKWSRMARGVNPIFQTGMVGRLLLPRLAEQGGRVGTWAQWMLSGAARHGGPARGLIPAPGWVAQAGSRLPSAGWGPFTQGGKITGLGAMRGLGVVGGAFSTASGAYNLYQQGNPVDAFEREGAGYVADVAETAFSASSTAFLIAPNPVTAALAVTTGVVWAGAEVVDNWDAISEGAGDALDTLTFWD